MSWSQPLFQMAPGGWGYLGGSAQPGRPVYIIHNVVRKLMHNNRVGSIGIDELDQSTPSPRDLNNGKASGIRRPGGTYTLRNKSRIGAVDVHNEHASGLKPIGAKEGNHRPIRRHLRRASLVYELRICSVPGNRPYLPTVPIATTVIDAATGSPIDRMSVPLQFSCAPCKHEDIHIIRWFFLDLVLRLQEGDSLVIHESNLRSMGRPGNPIVKAGQAQIVSLILGTPGAINLTLASLSHKLPQVGTV